MREYHIYMQRTKRTEWHCDYSIYKWLSWECVGHVKGTKELYMYFKSKFPYSMRSINFYHSFNYFDDEYSKIKNNCDDYGYTILEYYRYLIVDEQGNVRDFYQLTKKYKKKGPVIWIYSHRGGGWDEHWVKLTSDQRKSITPEEIRDIKDEYGIILKPIKPKRKIDSWNYKCNKISGWKMQSKRKKQWKVRKET